MIVSPGEFCECSPGPGRQVQKITKTFEAFILPRELSFLRRVTANAARLKIPAKMRQGFISKSRLATMLRVHIWEVNSWIRRGWLKATVMQIGEVTRTVIKPDDFFQFCQEHRKAVIGNRLNLERLEFIYKYVFPPDHNHFLSVREHKKERHRITIKEAVDAVLEDEKGRQLRKGTTGQSKTLLQQQLIPWAHQEGLRFLDELTVSVLTRFRAYWSKDLENCQNTARRKHERLCGFFHFCIRSEWLNKNPARLLKPIKVNRVPTGYYTRDEFARIIDATYAYGSWKGGHDFQHRGKRLRALLLLMRWGGLSITDAVTLERDKLTADGKLFLYRAKTGTPVYVPLPTEIVNLLREIPNSNPRYFLWSGTGERESAKKSWGKSLRRLFKSANLREADGTAKRCTAHMCRDTFAVELLLSGVPLDQVSLLLAHDSIKVTEKHYAPFVKARQEQLEASVRLAWRHMSGIVASESQPASMSQPN